MFYRFSRLILPIKPVITVPFYCYLDGYCVIFGKNAHFDQASPEQSDHLPQLIFKKTGWSVKSAEGGQMIRFVYFREYQVTA